MLYYLNEEKSIYSYKDYNEQKRFYLVHLYFYISNVVLLLEVSQYHLPLNFSKGNMVRVYAVVESVRPCASHAGPSIEISFKSRRTSYYNVPAHGCTLYRLLCRPSGHGWRVHPQPTWYIEQTRDNVIYVYGRGNPCVQDYEPHISHLQNPCVCSDRRCSCLCKRIKFPSDCGR